MHNPPMKYPGSGDNPGAYFAKLYHSRALGTRGQPATPVLS
jgi:hypothetical protein